MTVISKELIVKQFSEDKTGRVVSVNDSLFKYVTHTKVIVIKKVNLEELFNTQVIPAGKIYTDVDVTDHNAVFQAWATYFGIDDLPISDVVLSGGANIVNVEITKSSIYTGDLVLKTK